jgi:predicted ester cyclase
MSSTSQQPADDDAKAVVRRSWEDVYSRGNIDAVAEVFDPHCVSHDPTFPDGRLEDADAIIGNIRHGHAAYENWRFVVEGLYREGEYVVSRVTMYGRHVGEFLGIPPTGVEVTVGGITINRVVGGRIVERWGNWDTLGMLQTLGALPKVRNVG